MEKSPCYKRNPCPDRHLGCHSACEAFRAWEKIHQAEKDRARQEKEWQRGLDNISFQAIRKRRTKR